LSEPISAAVDETELLAVARSARDRAYAPYSGFRVGAALSADGSVYSGANVENASYGLSICAERVAAVTAVASGARRFGLIAVASSGSSPTAPCGACRQVLFEFGPDVAVVSEGPNGERKRWSLSELLPDAFGPADLGTLG
jgi:cytidine deaminase